MNKTIQKTNFIQKYLPTILVIGILTIITVGFRLYKIQTPLVEYHSWRQADTLAVARNYVRNGINLLLPKYDDISKLQSGLENPQGYRMVEFPIYNAIIALFSMFVPGIPIEQVGRIVSILCSLVTVFLIYQLVLETKNKMAAWFAAIIFAVFPFFVFYTRAVLPENLAVTLIMLSVFFATRKHKYYLRAIFAFIFFGFATLVKPTAAFYGLAPFGVLVLEKPIRKNKFIITSIIAAISLLPLLIWRQYIKNFPEGIPSSEWLLTHINTDRGLESIFFKPAFFRWIFYERLNLLILGSYAFSLPIIGLLTFTRKHIHYLFVASSAIYLFTFQGGNVQHEYYQIMILPTIAILTGIGAEHLIKSQKNIYLSWAAGFIVVGLLASAWLVSYEKVMHYYYSLSDIPQFARIVKDLTSPDDKIIVDTQGDTTALFAFDRKGAPAMVGNPDELRNMGYSYIFTYNQETADNLIKGYDLKVMFRNNRFALLKL